MSEHPVSASENASPGLPEGRFSGRQLFADLVRGALATAAREGWPQLWLCDADFADWPLGEREVVASLNAWATHGRSLRLLARDYGALRQRHPRFVQWRTTWSHLVEAQACAHASPADLPSVLWSPVWTLQRLDPVHCTMVGSRDAARRVDLREQLQAWWLRGSSGFPASTLGL